MAAVLPVLQVLWLNEEASVSAPVTPGSPATAPGECEGGMTAEMVPGGASACPPKSRPQHTSPDPSFATEVSCQLAATHPFTQAPRL